MLTPHAPLHRNPTGRVALAFIWLLLSVAGAQTFDPERYHRQCLAFEQGGDYETARQSCLNALAADPRHAQARLTLARIELTLGELAEAENTLRQLGNSVQTAEPQLLLAEIMIRSARYLEAEAALAEAGRRVASSGDGEWAEELASLRGELAERQGRFGEALLHYREAVRLDPSQRPSQLRLASLLFEMGDAGAAKEQLETYLSLANNRTDAEISSLLGRTLWARGELRRAASELERSLSLRGRGDGAEQARDLRALGLIYYGLGDGDAGNLAMREAARRGNLFATFFSGNLAWLLLLLVVLATHLIGESRIGVTSGPETSEGPRRWKVEHVYGLLWSAILTSLPAAVLYGVLRYDNVLALLTPIQSSDTLAVFYVVFSLVVAAGAWRRVATNGWPAGGMLLGGNERIPLGVFLGLLMLAATLAYRFYVPPGVLRADFFLNLVQITPAAAIALALIPLSEIYFRAFAFPALETRYGANFALIISAGLYTLIFATPVLLLLAIGLLLTSSYQSTRSGAMTVTAQLVLHLGLLVSVVVSPWARALFV